MSRKPSPLNRRHALAGAAAIGVTAPLLAACSTDDEPRDTAADETTPSGPSSASPAETSDTPSDASAGAPGTVATADVPVGGGLIVADRKVVVTQPVAGEFKAFSAVCTHAGCLVNSVSDTINCKCHGSAFSLTDGSAVTPPATTPLPAAPFTVDGDSITLT